MSLQTTLEETGDGTGDLILVLPAQLVAQLGWAAGDQISVATRTKANEIVLQRNGVINQKQFDEMRKRGRR